MEGSAEDSEKRRPKVLANFVASCLSKYFPMMSWTEDDVVLDVGFGDGGTTRNILLPKCPKLKKIVAIDVNPAYLDYANANFHHEKIEFRTQNILDGFKDVQKYDKIVSFYTLHYICDYNKLFSVISTLLKPGGYFFFIIVESYPSFSVIRELCNSEEWKKHVKEEDLLTGIPPHVDWEDTEAEFKRFLLKFDLEVTGSEYEVTDLSFPDRKRLMEFFLTVLPKVVFEKVSPEVKSHLWKQTEPLFFKHGARTENNEFRLPVKFLQLFGVKKYVLH